MENLCKIIFFGDSNTKLYCSIFEEALREEYPYIELEIINAGISGETSSDGLTRIGELVAQAPQVVVIGFGMNDWRKGVPKKEFRHNINKIVDEFEKAKSRVILVTINPCKGSNKKVDEYSCIIREIAREKKLKIADVNSLWKRELKPARMGLRDDIHPNDVGFDIYCKALMRIVPRRNTVILWQYNGHEAKCNYHCPYCYYVGLHHPDDNFFGTIEQWHRGFKNSFGNQHLVFYLAFGEPTIGEAFYDIVEMISSEPNWELRITSNVSVPTEKLVKSKVAKEGRLHINASFHPLAVSIEKFLKKILFLRENGIEVPVVYVMYPPFLRRFEEDIAVFSEHNFVVHVRRFQGEYKGKIYPYAYTDGERQLIARYSDYGMIKYMLNQQHNTGELTYSGLHFFVVDNVGNVGYDSNVFHPYTKYRCIFGNILQGNFRPLLEPGPYPGEREGTVDGVANLVEAGYHELEGNNVLSFMKQGGVYRTENGVYYKHLKTNFEDSRIRAEYRFPPRNLKDEYYIYLYLGKKYWWDLLKRTLKPTKSTIKRMPFAKRITKGIFGESFIQRFK